MTAYEQYMSLRDRWHWIVRQRDKADADEKGSVFAQLSRLWGRMSRSEQRCAGMHAIIVYHGAER